MTENFSRPTQTFVRRMPFKRAISAEPTMCMVEIEINMEHLFSYLGFKAFLNMSKKSIALQGDIIATVREVKGPNK